MPPSKIFDRKNILVTGGAGFIGSHLCQALLKDAHVICMDNFSTSTVANIQPLLQHPNFEFINHDITQPFQLSDFPELKRFQIDIQGVQEIYHLACPISRTHFEDYKIATLLTNSLGTKHVMDVAVASHASVVFASSSSIYGPRREDQVLVAETDACIFDHLTPHGVYDEGKRFAESILYTYADVYGLDVKIARIFRTYGPGMRLADGHLIPDLVNAALEGAPLEIPSEEAVITLCYISDLVDGLVHLMKTPIETTVMNLGSDQEVPLSTVATLIGRLADSSSSVHVEPSLDFSSSAARPDTARARQVLHWLPIVSLEEGMRRMVEDAKSRRLRLQTFS